MALLETLTDNFDDNSLDSGKWTATLNGGTVTEQNQRLELAGDANPDEPTVRSANTYDLTGSYQFGNVSGFASGGTQKFGVEDASGDRYLIQLAASLTFRKIISGVDTQIGAGLTYNATTHAWWRIRESGGTIFGDTAPSSASNPPAPGDWVNRWSQATDAGFDPTAVKAYLLLFVSSGTNKTMFVDGYNTGTVAASGFKPWFARGSNILLD